MKKKVLQKKGAVFAKGELTLQEIINDVLSSDEKGKIGAIYSFTGVVRTSSLKSEKKVASIEIEAWEEKATEELDKLCHTLIEKYSLVDLRIYHAVGNFNIGDALIFIVSASSHRNEGHAVLLDAIEFYKHRVAIWKKEIYEDGTSSWISDTPYTNF